MLSMGCEQPAVIDPVHPFERGVFDGFKRSPRATAVDDLGLKTAFDRLGRSVVIAIADAADR